MLAKIVCTHNGDPAGPTAATYTLVAEKASLRPLFDDLPRGSTIVTCPGNIQSPGPWRRNATPQQVSGTLVCSDGLAAVTWTPEANLLVSAPCRSSWAGAQPALPMVVGALLTSGDQGRHAGCPHRLGGRQEGGVTLKLGLRGFVWRPAAVARCGVITMTNRRTLTVRCATRARFIEAMSGGPVPLRLPQRRGVAGERGTTARRVAVRPAARAAVSSTRRAIVAGRSDCGAWPAIRSGLKRDPGMSGR